LQALAKTVILQELPFRETVSSGRYMKQAGKFMLKMLLGSAFLVLFCRGKNLVFLVQELFFWGLFVVCVSFFTYHTCAVISAFQLDC